MNRVKLPQALISQGFTRDVVVLVESKEMARNALPTTAASISSFRHQRNAPTEQAKADKKSNRSMSRLWKDIRFILRGSCRME